MTLDRLEAHRTLVCDMKSARENLELAETSAGVGAQKLDGMPHSGGVHRTIEFSVEEIERRREDLKQCEDAVKASEPEIKAFIAEIIDKKTRSAFRLRYLEAKPWKEVADAFVYETPGAIKSRVYNYIAASEKSTI